MNRGSNPWRGGRILLTALVLMGIFSRPCLAQKIQVNPANLKIEAFFGGATLKVSGEIPAGAEAVIEVIGPKVEQELMRKGRRWDLWLNVGEIDIKGVPGFYLVASSDPKLLTPTTTARPWGYGLWQRRARFQGALKPGEEPLIFKEFIELKEGWGLYGRFPGAVKVAAAGGGRSRAQASFPINTRIAPGTYRLRLSAVKGQQVVQRTQTTWQVDMAGSPAFLTFLAMQRPVLYGLLALGLAAAVGFLSGVLFKQRRRGQPDQGPPVH
jgi:hypothetical protein